MRDSQPGGRGTPKGLGGNISRMPKATHFPGLFLHGQGTPATAAWRSGDRDPSSNCQASVFLENPRGACGGPGEPRLLDQTYLISKKKKCVISSPERLWSTPTDACHTCAGIFAFKACTVHFVSSLRLDRGPWYVRNISGVWGTEVKKTYEAPACATGTQ